MTPALDKGNGVKLTARFNGPPQLTGTALIMLCAYRGGCGNRPPWSAGDGWLGRLIDGLTLYKLRSFIAVHRDHFANPRDLAYQIALAEAVLARAHFTSFDLLVDAPLAEGGPDIAIDGANDVRIGEVARAVPRERGRCETIVLVYPDALGLSWSRLEGKSLAVADRVVIVTGRRRLFTLDRAARRALLWRRLLATTRGVELLMAVVVVPLAAVLAAWDRLRRPGRPLAAAED